jgi:hypothetical protein
MTPRNGFYDAALRQNRGRVHATWAFVHSAVHMEPFTGLLGDKTEGPLAVEPERRSIGGLRYMSLGVVQSP